METQEVTMEQTTFTDTEAAGSRRPEPVVLDSPHYYHLARVALTLHAEELDSLAKKNTAEGRTREARTILEDAAAIRERIVPQLAAQREFPFVSAEQLEKAIAGALSPMVFRAFDGAGDDDITKDAFERRRDRLLQALTKRVYAFARDVAESAHHTGYQARMTTPELLAYDEVSALSLGGIAD